MNNQKNYCIFTKKKIMGAPKGNQFWKLRSKHGRNRIIQDPETLAAAADEYFKQCIDNPIKITDFKGKDAKKVELELPKVFQKNELARYCGLSEWQYINHLKGVSEDFYNIVTRIEGIIADQKFQYGVVNIFNSNIVARDLGLRDKSELSVSAPEIIVNNEDTKMKIEKL